jgi:hypothetical protein
LSCSGRQPPVASSFGVLYPTQGSLTAIQRLYQKHCPFADTDGL